MPDWRASAHASYVELVMHRDWSLPLARATAKAFTSGPPNTMEFRVAARSGVTAVSAKQKAGHANINTLHGVPASAHRHAERLHRQAAGHTAFAPSTIVAITFPAANMSLARTTAARSEAAFTAEDPWVGTTIMNGPPYTICEGIIVCKC